MTGRSATHVEDMAGIEKLHSQDVAATLSGDLGALSELWTAKVLRVLKNQAHGSWKAAMGMWNTSG
jgi:hypothetical protein